MIIALEPVCAIIGAWWLFGDQPSLRMAAGAALIVLATFLKLIFLLGQSLLTQRCNLAC
ncbi:hypothetical protein STW0522PSE72_24790 [Pseudomonas monteilii]|nr:hypothetical protein STW0522PSE72_24790 [Pseudomonas monteilii]